MNMQALMKQAQKMQQDVMKEKKEIDEKVFVESYSMITVEVNGKKELLKLTISKDIDMTADDVEMLEDSIIVALNNVFKKIDDETEKRLGKYGQGLSGLM